jgi:hypothetical protein
MAKSVLDIIIKLSKQGGADQETVKGLVSMKTAIMGTAAVAGTLVAAGFAVKKVLDETVGTMVSYANEVRRIQDATGATAEDSSKLIQVLDDQKVSFEQLEKVVAKNGKTYDFTIDGLARMSDEFMTLTDEQEKSKFMNERFGKQWISFVPVMKMGGQVIRDASDAVSDSLVLTQKGVDDARQYEIAVDNLTDAWTGFKVSIGSTLVGPVTDLLNHINALTEADTRLREEGLVPGSKAFTERRIELIAQIKAEQDSAAATLMHGDAMQVDTEAAAENAEAIKAISAAHKDMLGLIGTVASAEQSYQETAKSLTAERITIEQERAAALQLGWWEGSEKIKEFDRALAENGAKVEENAAKHRDAMAKIQFDLIVTKASVDGITDAEMIMIEQAGLMFGQFDQKSIDSSRNFNLVAGAVADGTLQVEDFQKALDLLPSLKTIDVVTNFIEKYSTQNLINQGVPPSVAASVGYAAGGISSGPTSGHMELLHGTEAVIPLQNGSVPVQMMGSGSVAGGDNIYVSLTIASPMTILDEQTAQRMLTPFIVNGIRQAKAQGAIK